MLVVAMAHYNRISISVAGAERLIPELGITERNMGLVYSAYLVVYTLAMLPGGWFIDRFGARTALLLLGFGSTIFVAMTGLVGLVAHGATSIWLGLLAVRSLLGFASAPLHPGSARAVFEEVPPRSRGLGNGLVTFSACLGIAVSYHAMGTLIDHFDWPVAFLISSGCTFAIAVVWTIGTRKAHQTTRFDSARRAASSDLGALLRVIRKRGVICVTLSYVAYGYFQYLFFYWIEYYFVTIQRQDVAVGRRYSTMITLAMGAGMVSGGWLLDRVPRSFSPRMRRAVVPVLGMITSGVVFELGVLAPSAGATLTAFAISAALLGVCEAAFWTTVVEMGGPLGGTAAGLMNTGGNAGGTLSPYLTPLFSELFAARYGPDAGWRLGLGIAGIVVVAGAGLWCGVDPRCEADGSDTGEDALTVAKPSASPSITDSVGR
jgi:MFS family permease